MLFSLNYETLQIDLGWVEALGPYRVLIMISILLARERSPSRALRATANVSSCPHERPPCVSQHSIGLCLVSPCHYPGELIFLEIGESFWKE